MTGERVLHIIATVVCTHANRLIYKTEIGYDRVRAAYGASQLQLLHTTTIDGSLRMSLPRTNTSVVDVND